MNVTKKFNTKVTFFLAVSSFFAAHLCFQLLPSVFETWNAKVVDQLFLFRSESPRFRPLYDGTIVHVDLNNTSIRQLKNFYLNRTHHAQVIRNLSAMGVSAQLYDFIFASKSDEKEDLALINAVSRAGNVYFGMAFQLDKKSNSRPKEPNKTSEDLEYLDRTKWQVVVESDSRSFYRGHDPLITFTELSNPSKGLGYLNIKFDQDGVYRRIPLIVHYKDAFYPSIAFRAVCDYLKISPDKIFIKPGKTITLKDARRPGESSAHDIVIPIDRHGNMIINFIGPWARMKHYNFSDIYRASEDRDELDMWKEVLSGKIVVVSEVTTGSSDVGPVPTDNNFPLSGTHANLIHTILTESFFREISALEMLLIELFLVVTILGVSIRFSSLIFSLGTIGVGVTYFCLAAIFFLYGQIIVQVVRPLLMVGSGLVLILIYRYINEEKDKEVVNFRNKLTQIF